jgi:hypothetical protein
VANTAKITNKLFKEQAAANRETWWPKWSTHCMFPARLNSTLNLKWLSTVTIEAKLTSWTSRGHCDWPVEAKSLAAKSKSGISGRPLDSNQMAQR